jgi:CHASE2 domain-containing sensor protein/signal transduction histidine kinase
VSAVSAVPWLQPFGSRRGEWTVALLLALLAFALAAAGWTWRGDRVVYDFGLSAWSRPPPPDVVIIAIDDASIEAIGRWPWPRAVHSTVLHQLALARPRAIGLDLILSEADPDAAQDQLLALMLQRAAPVVLPVAWQAGSSGSAPRVLKPAGELGATVVLGAAEAAVDADGVLRHAFLHTQRGEERYPHMALALLQAGGDKLPDGFPVVREAQGPEAATATTSATATAGWVRADRFLIRYAGPPGHVKRVSYVDVLRGAVPPETLKGRYVLLGMTALGLGDTLATPVNRQQHAMPGVEVLANTLYTLRSGDTLNALSPWASAALAAALVLMLVLAFERVGTRWALVLALGSVPTAFGASLLALGAGWWWSPLPYALAAALAYPFWSWRRLERAVDSLDVEIRRLDPAGGVPLETAPYAMPAPDPRDRLASRLDTLHAATETVRSARRFLADALAGMPTAMLVADEKGRVLLANALTAQLFEVETAADMQGLDLPGLLVEFTTPQPVDWQALLADGGATPPGGLAIETQLARLGDFLLHFASVMLLGQQRWVVTFADVTAIKQAQRRRDETLAFITHDLRSPASSIMLLADLHLQGHMSMAQDELLGEVRRLAARTLQLSDDIVRLAHAEARPLNLVLAPLSALLDEVLADFRPQALTAEVQLQSRLHDAQAAWVIDRPLVVRALGNLLSNAIKHSPRSSVVEIRSTLREHHLVLTVNDSGPGLNAEQRQKLQNEAQGLPAGDARGVGLGLLFVQRVASRHRGQLLARAGAGGVGTSFELLLGELPIEPSQA